MKENECGSLTDNIIRTNTSLWVVRESLSEEEPFKLRPGSERKPATKSVGKSMLGKGKRLSSKFQWSSTCRVVNVKGTVVLARLNHKERCSLWKGVDVFFFFPKCHGKTLT